MKMLRTLKVLALSLCALFVSDSCEDIFGPDDPYNPYDPYTPDPVSYEISVSPNGKVSFPAEGGSVNFTVTTNADYTGCTYPNRDWLSIEHESGSRLYVVSVSANTSGSERTFELTFYAKAKGSDEKVATTVVQAVQPVAQAGTVWVSASPTMLEFSADGGEQSTVVNWSDGVAKLWAACRSALKGWVTLSWKDSGGQKLLVVKVQPNDSGAERSGSVDILGSVSAEDMEDAKNGNINPSRSGATVLVVKQAGSGGQPQGGDVPEGALSSLITVNSSGLKVRFSQGNLQYQSSTKTWRFAEKQWDYVGSDNHKIGHTYSGWIDLFGWGTSGYYCGNYYWLPDDCNTKYDEYYSHGIQYGPKGETSLTGSNANCDWGVYNAISNGGNQAGMWRTLTYDEFYYLLFARSTSSGYRFAKAKVNDVNGLIIFPDNWNASTYYINEINEVYPDYSVNKISSSKWSEMEDDGCVFLPAAGMREEADPGYVLNVVGVGRSGEYWTATGEATESDATFLHIYDDSMTFKAWPRCEGRSVRLVQNI